MTFSTKIKQSKQGILREQRTGGRDGKRTELGQREIIKDYI